MLGECYVFHVCLPPTIHGEYDMYSDFVCIAKTLDDARHMHPGSGSIIYEKEEYNGDAWVPFESLQELQVCCFGVAYKPEQIGVVSASFCAG